jgi:hypothetical protein
MNWPGSIADAFLTAGLVAILAAIGGGSASLWAASIAFVAALLYLGISAGLHKPPVRVAILCAITVACAILWGLHGGAITLLFALFGWLAFGLRRYFTVGTDVEDEPQLKYLYIDVVLIVLASLIGLSLPTVLPDAATLFVIAVALRLWGMRTASVAHSRAQGMVAVASVRRPLAYMLVIVIAALVLFLLFHTTLLNLFNNLLLPLLLDLLAIIVAPLVALLELIKKNIKPKKGKPLNLVKKLHVRHSSHVKITHVPLALSVTIDVIAAILVVWLLYLLYKRYQGNRHKPPGQPTAIPRIERHRLPDSPEPDFEPPTPLRALFSHWRESLAALALADDSGAIAVNRLPRSGRRTQPRMRSDSVAPTPASGTTSASSQRTRMETVIRGRGTTAREILAHVRARFSASGSAASSSRENGAARTPAQSEAVSAPVTASEALVARYEEERYAGRVASDAEVAQLAERLKASGLLGDGSKGSGATPGRDGPST